MSKYQSIKSKNRKIIGFTPILLIILVFVFASFFMTEAIRNYYYSLLEDESYRLTRSYTNNLEIAMDAREITTNILDDRIVTVSIAVANMGIEENFNNLDTLSIEFNVDNIYLYSKEGVVIDSSDGSYIGWTFDENHPINRFLLSDDMYMVEDIRADTESGILYKYGYYKLEDGRFLQVSILADKILAFLNTFDIQLLIERIFLEEDIINASFYDKSGKIIASSDAEYIGTFNQSSSILDVISKNLEVSFLTEYKGESAYQVIIPLKVDGELEGALSIINSLVKTNNAINDFITIGLVALFVIFALLIIFNIIIFKNNKILEKMAYFDSLTDLPNRESLIFELKDIINRNNFPRGLLLINISDFKSINMTYGYEYGDSILKIIARKLKEEYSKQHKVFRFGSDRFVIIADYKSDRKILENIIFKIKDVLESEFYTQGQKRIIDINMGVVEISNNYKKPDEIIRDATIAVSYVDGRKNISHAFYNNDMLNRIRREETIESEIIDGLLDPQLEKLFLVYQPIIDTQTKKVKGFEALARLKTDSFGFISPVEFIDIAEKRLLINRLGEWIFQSALLFLRELEFEGYSDIKISINISGVQLMDPTFKSKILDKILSSRINPKNVTLEVTESVLFDNYESVNNTLKELRNEGIVIALDDFGTGYSSFSRLRDLNIDCIKIDKTFIDKVGEVKDENLLSGDIISLSHKLGLFVVAEGVETGKQVKYLEERDCDLLQGYYFSKPLEIGDVIKFLEKQP